MQWVDLSLPLEDDSHFAPRWARSSVKYQSHHFGRRAMRWLFGIKRKHLATGSGWANDVISLSTHGTTHVDAPWHYSRTCAGKPARTIDEIPLDWCVGPGVVLDLRHLDGQAAASPIDIQDALAAIDYTLRGGDIVLVQTGNDAIWGQREYFDAGPGVSAEATVWLIDQGVRMMGIDAWGWDSPLKRQAEQAKRSGRSDIFWAAHYVGVEREFCHMERLANLDKIPQKGFTVYAFPLKVKRGSAGPARVVARVDMSLA